MISGAPDDIYIAIPLGCVYRYCILQSIADEVTEQHREAMRVCQDTVKSTAQLLSQEHKDIHAPISKLGRSIDKVSTKIIIH